MILLMHKRFIGCFFSLFSFFLLCNLVFAKEPVPVKDLLSLNHAKEKDICIAVKKTIKEGAKTKEVVKTGIQLGHNACLIVKCAIQAEGNLKEIIIGAIEAGATQDVVARCAIDAEADAREVAQYIREAGFAGLCYVEPQEIEPIDPNLPGDETTGRGFVSPSAP